MALNQTQRWSVLGGALLLTLGAIYLVQGEEGQDETGQGALAAPMPRAQARANRLSPSAAPQAAGDLLPDLARSRQRQAQAVSDAAADLFQAHAWYVAPPPVPVQRSQTPPEALAPVVPVLPYQYMGQLDDVPEGTLVFLAARNRVYSVGVGQVLDKVWRLDRVDAQALYLTYVPLSTSLVLSKNAKPAAVASATPGDPEQPSDR